MNLLYLVHRLPWPPNKGDKVRSHHLLRHLAGQGHRVFLGSFIDDPADAGWLPDVRALCAGVCAPALQPRQARVASLRGLLRAEPLTLSYYRNAELLRWVQGVVARESIDAVLVFSSSMAPYALHGAPAVRPLLVDFVDVDSAKWTAYAPRHRWPLSALYRREGRLLLAYERAVAAQADHAYFAADTEAELFRSLAPESAARISGLANGVDADFFAPRADRASPYAAGEVALVFTGAMDYWPNADAVCWFAAEMLPRLRARHPALRLHIVGRSPTAAVRALAGPAVNVTGSVDDVRPWLQHAAVAVAPLRLARGIQNKVLEAMAAGVPVVAAQDCARALDATPGVHLLAAADAATTVAQVEALLADPGLAARIGAAGRERVQAVYGWSARLQALDAFLTPASATAAGHPSHPSLPSLSPRLPPPPRALPAAVNYPTIDR